tara:strand:- start:2720 stop:3685 length:966 start_codon:yes stop_codon:yes gene_type:complete
MFDFRNSKNKKIFPVLGIISKVNIKLLITLLCLTFLAVSIYGNFESLAKQSIGFEEILWILGGIFFSFISIIINASAWKFLIDSIGCDSNKLNIIKIFINTNIYKYMPGGVWHFVARYNMLRSEFSIEKSIESILLEPLLMLVAALFFIPFNNFNIFILILCWSSSFLFLTGFRDFIVRNLKRMKESIFRNKDNSIYLVQNKNQFTTKISYPYQALFVEIIFILFRFMGFLCCFNAFFIEPSISNSELITFFCFAWIVGLIVPAAPGGLGVFETVILFGLGDRLPEAPVLASLISYRLVSTLSDVIAALIFPIKRFIPIRK